MKPSPLGKKDEMFLLESHIPTCFMSHRHVKRSESRKGRLIHEPDRYFGIIFNMWYIKSNLVACPFNTIWFEVSKLGKHHFFFPPALRRQAT